MSKWSWKNNTSRPAPHRVATSLQFVKKNRNKNKNTVSVKCNKMEYVCISIHICFTCVHKSMHIYTYACECIITGVCVHTHTHTHTHTPAFKSPELSAVHCSLSASILDLKHAAFAHVGMLQGQKNEFLPFPMQEFYHSCCNSGRSCLLSSFACVCFMSVYLRAASPSPLDLLINLLTTYRFPWAEASSWAGPHPPAICESQDPGPVAVWNRNQKVLELLCAQYYSDFRRVSPFSTQRNLSQNLDMGSFSYYLEISLDYP